MLTRPLQATVNKSRYSELEMDRWYLPGTFVIIYIADIDGEPVIVYNHVTILLSNVTVWSRSTSTLLVFPREKLDIFAYFSFTAIAAIAIVVCF